MRELNATSPQMVAAWDAGKTFKTDVLMSDLRKIALVIYEEQLKLVKEIHEDISKNHCYCSDDTCPGCKIAMNIQYYINRLDQKFFEKETTND